MNLTAKRFDAIQQAWLAQDPATFEIAALAVIGLGGGLTPSGDDFLGGIFYADFWLRKNAPSNKNLPLVPNAKRALADCHAHSHPRSARLMHDLIHGISAGPLQEMLQALHDNDDVRIRLATQRLYAVGSSSGADMLAGVLTYLQAIHASPRS